MYLKVCIILVCMVSMVFARDRFTRVQSLKGDWLFTVGDDKVWADPASSDDDWVEVRVPRSWEDEGFPGYDGYAWYRLTFKFEETDRDKVYYLFAGLIDDTDETYFNGQLIGSAGTMPPNYSTAYHYQRKYQIPADLINYGSENTIAIRVFDVGGEGGIKYGKVGIYVSEPGIEMLVDLQGSWKFKPGDNKLWHAPEFDDKEWDNIQVPGIWQQLGYPGMHGFAWYRTSFFLKDLPDDEYILLLGRIDDMDQTFLNGQRIGETGRMHDHPRDIRINDEDYSTMRAYYLPKGVLKRNSRNVVAVRVYDGPGEGGIYEGPLGIVRRKEYLKRKRRLEEKFDIGDLLEAIFE